MGTTPEVGSAKVSVIPTLTGFRRTVDAEVGVSTKSASSKFSQGFKAAGDLAGKGFAGSFKSATAGVTGASLKQASEAVAKASREVSAARLKELDTTGRVRLAETQLTDARARFASGSVQVVRAEERLAAQERALAAAEANTAGASSRLASAKLSLASATDAATASGQRMGGAFGRLPGILNDAGNRGARRFSQGFLDVLGGALGANILTGIGFTIGRGINQGIGLALNAGFDSVQLASNLAETTSAVKQVFGAAAPEILSFAKSANTALGQTQQQALAGAQTFGVFARQAKLTGKPLSDFSTGLVTLSGDLASFFNTSPDDALQAISAGLRGESEPLRRYGVILSDAALKQRAMTLGIFDGTGALTGQQRVLAAQAEIFAQTSIAQGDFARTSDGLANQQRILQASLEQTQAKFGEFLLPAFTSAATYANDTLLPRLDGVIDRVGPKLQASLEKSAPAVGKLLDKVTPLVESFITWGGEEGIPAVIGGLDDFVTAIPGWVDAFGRIDEAGQHFEDFLDTVGVTSNKPQQAIEDAITGWFTDISTSQFGDFGSVIGTDVGNGAKTGLQGTDPFSFENFGTGQTTDGNFADFATFGRTGGTAVGRGAADAVKESDPFNFDNFGTPEPSKFKELGRNYGQSLADGILGRKKEVSDAGREVAQAAVTATQQKFDIRSPSHVGTEFGSNYAGSIAGGMLDEVTTIKSAAEDLVSAAAFAATPASVTTAAGAAAASAAVIASGISSPDTLVLVDQDGQVIGRMRVEASDTFDRKLDAIKTEVLAGGTA